MRVEGVERGQLPRGRHGLPREAVLRSQHQRLETAVVAATAARGFEETTVADILDLAGVGRETFYELFADKRECMLAAHDHLVDQLEAEVRGAYLGPAPWTGRLRAAIATALGFFADRPPVARFMLVELFAVGEPARQRFAAGFGRFVALLEEGLDPELVDDGPLRPASLAFTAVAARAYEEVVIGRAAELRGLTDELVYELAVPFVGEGVAREAAGSAGAGRVRD